MKRMSGVAAACLVASLFQGCAMQPEKPKEPQYPKAPPLKISDDQLRLVQSQYMKLQEDLARFREAALVKDDTPCDTQSGEDRCVQITMFQWDDGSGKGPFCVGLIPEEVKFTGTGLFNRTKTIAWQLVLQDPNKPIQPAGSYFEFLGDGDQGILVFKNFGGYQVRNGARVSGNNTRYRIDNLHRIKGSASYLPIVVHVVPGANPGDDPKVGLCGTPDPRIVNE